MKTRWEYQVLRIETEGMIVGGNVDPEKLARLLNGAGGEGWELISAFDTNMLNGMTRHIVLVMKRPAE